jgi:hypothetical protein
VRDFVLTMNGDSPCPINPLAMHRVYVEGNMASISTTIPIDISKTPGAIENVFIGVDSPPKRFKLTPSYSRSYATFFPGLMRRCQVSTHEFSSMKSRLVLMENRFDKIFIRLILEKRQ